MSNPDHNNYGLRSPLTQAIGTKDPSTPESYITNPSTLYALNQDSISQSVPYPQGNINVPHYIVPCSGLSEFKPDERQLAFCPSLDGEHFFAPIDEMDKESKREELEQMVAIYPYNLLQKYSAPPITDVPWLENQKPNQQFDNELASIQSQLAQITRPLDKFMVDTLADDHYDAQQTNGLISFANKMRHLIQTLCHSIHRSRIQNLQKARGMFFLFTMI
ncbi:hypothetical protein BX616_010226 [Lobosporangium transversale]|uniref:Uncharacterized protein n=1 Tax=Lobosporangium transversale TaxID=64571 RepID=A0A1Y2GWX5_9FUNG|nr:hypothetical protein BCR41DRAFT_333940 [Lobosporangium transversale]KAF9912769.1 hypothetical protein BX616_010226 [Lobosporangium transversale]ORZ23924.1 hypothetical protein BCR41DRAFT_333940 [Lobosporangium transversale]|eukprot:XP_021883738.1 hypothetical protein BCR41DRAFT_333940 [Lobosporangium transversale]